MIRCNTRPPRASSDAHRRKVLHLAIVSLFLASTMPPPAQAQAGATPPTAADARDYAIPAGPLSPALSRFAGQAGVTLSSDPALTDGLVTHGLQGRHGTAGGFARLLQGSGLRAVGLGGGVYRLERVPTEAAATLSTVTVTAQAERSALTEGINSYASREMSMAKGQAIRGIPQSVSVITRQQIEDQGMQTVDEVLRQMPGVMVGGDLYNGSGGRYYSRGYAMTNVQTDGNFDSSIGSFADGGNSIANLAMYDHVEVLRGADGLYSGVGESSGTINLVRKRPLDHFQGKATVAAGSWDDYRGEIDLTGPLAFDGKLRGRVVAAKQDRRYFYDYSKTDTDFVYGILEADIGERTLLTFGGSYEKSEGVPEGGGFPTYHNGRFLGLSRSTNWLTPWSKTDAEKSNAFISIQHELSDNWRVSSSANQTNYDTSQVIGRFVQPIDPNTNLVRRIVNTADDVKTTNTSFDLNISGRGSVRGIGYDLLVGVDRRKFDYEYYNPSTVFYAPGVSIHEVDMGSFAQPSLSGGSTIEAVTKQSGAYARLKIDLRDDVHLVLGGRYTDYDDETDDWSESGILTPYFGAVYDFNKSWSLYASTAKIYKSQANQRKGPINSTAPLDPMEGRNYEIGLKGDLYDGRLTGSLSVYRLERLGQAARDPAYDDITIPVGLGCCYINRGEVVSKGFEAEISGEILPRLQLSASYAYNHNEDKTTRAAYNVLTAPRHLFKLWGKYQFQGDWSRLSVGAGVKAQSKTWSEGYYANFGGNYKVIQSGYGVWDALVEYRIGKETQLALNIGNVFDKTYYAAISNNFYGNYYGTPRNYMLTLRTSF
ncbi:TonB-dependent siderophore receptor [Thauera linaloolentis]|uniref:TonB-dependent siderophore receptor n=1 Tax=Thauera linaloolentis (strain DSM 12138 / JCM 21573 / CCUG 41526 / CIP 105981 / IAM 15112 / NBRC 102519 / 47Lol) TaxID=1123367 RepID=N6YXG0_THAL4|nr:TonB-dependent receptor [Thauera linaloolentis]ENO87097.1 TonB-dependent siderophore receptor [Thauera linaloolentis 47Lol = DSM 12138]MCM8565504.1 TonB-dependent receptor [Thauera linaloolentis]